MKGSEQKTAQKLNTAESPFTTHFLRIMRVVNL